MLDTQACLAGNGAGGLVRAHFEQELMQPESLHTSRAFASPAIPFHQQEADMMPSMVRFAYGGLQWMGKVSQLAIRMRFGSPRTPNPQATATVRHTAIAQLQTEIYTYWHDAHPAFLARDTPLAAAQLSPRVRLLFEDVSNGCGKFFGNSD